MRGEHTWMRLSSALAGLSLSTPSFSGAMPNAARSLHPEEWIIISQQRCAFVGGTRRMRYAEVATPRLLMWGRAHYGPLCGDRSVETRPRSHARVPIPHRMRHDIGA